MSVAARFLLLCAVALVLPTTIAAQTSPPHLDPGWYKNSGPAVIYEDQDLKIVWENSYVYPYSGSDPLYWYAEVVYTYKGSATFEINCVGEGKLPPVKEHMRNTPKLRHRRRLRNTLRS